MRCIACNQVMDFPAINPFTRKPEDMCPACLHSARDIWPVKNYQHEDSVEGVTPVKKVD